MTAHVYTEDGRQLYTLRQLAEILDVPHETVKTRRHRQQLPEPYTHLDDRTPLWTLDPEPIMDTSAARTAARIIAGARDRYATSPEMPGGADAFDYMVAREGVARYGELYQETYSLANEGHPQVATGVAAEAEMEERKQRATDLWQQVLPELEAYAAGCKAAEYTGWSRQSGGPIRRVR